MKDRPDLLGEDRAMLEALCREIPEPLRARLTEILRRVDLDFFGLDFGFLPDGKMLLFEANASMHFNRYQFDKPYYRYGGLSVPLAEQGFNSLLNKPTPS
jgi:hypothetical protein